MTDKTTNEVADIIATLLASMLAGLALYVPLHHFLPLGWWEYGVGIWGVGLTINIFK